jgi:DNA-binding MarR family transcriptional regulator
MRLGRQLSLTSKMVRTHLDRRLVEQGSTLPAFVLLHVLSQSCGMSQRALAERVGIEPPTCNRHVDHLVAAGLLGRDRLAADRRITVITLTPEGRRLHERLEVVVNGFDAELSDVLGAEATEACTMQLEAIRIHLAKEEPDDATQH